MSRVRLSPEPSALCTGARHHNANALKRFNLFAITNSLRIYIYIVFERGRSAKKPLQHKMQKETDATNAAPPKR